VTYSRGGIAGQRAARSTGRIMQKLTIAVALVLIGCGGENNSGPPAPTACQRTDRSGTYRQYYTTQGGNCGELDSELVSYDAPTPGASTGAGPACTIEAERWSENDCKLERTVACTSPDFVTTGTGVSRQQTEDGSMIGGTFTVSVRLRDGSTCRGTYGLTAYRQ
jgi:hypothetical protein